MAYWSTQVENQESKLSIKHCKSFDTVEWNAEIAYKQTIFQALGITDGFIQKVRKSGGLEELKHKTAIYNKSVIAAGGD